MESAACHGSATNGSRDLFFPGPGETTEEVITRFCFRCTVRKECNDYADRVGAVVGVWGGVRRTRATHGTEYERRGKR